MHRLDHKFALVTGASRGTGAAIARRFVAEGARFVLVDILDLRGEAVATELGRTLGPFLGTRTGLPALRASMPATVVKPGSIDSMPGAVLTGAYTASKCCTAGPDQGRRAGEPHGRRAGEHRVPMLGDPEMHPEIVATDSGPIRRGNTAPDLDVIAEVVC